MRQEFWKLLYDLMKKDKNVWCLVGDLGYGGADRIKRDFPERFLNCGAAEFAMCGIASGLALSGKIPFIYTITPFYYRAFEMIRTYIDHEKIPVVLVGSGRNQEYTHDGYSHNALDIEGHMQLLPHFVTYIPDTTEAMREAVKLSIKSKQPSFVSLSKTI